MKKININRKLDLLAITVCIGLSSSAKIKEDDNQPILAVLLDGDQERKFGSMIKRRLTPQVQISRMKMWQSQMSMVLDMTQHYSGYVYDGLGTQFILNSSSQFSRTTYLPQFWFFQSLEKSPDGLRYSICDKGSQFKCEIASVKISINAIPVNQEN